MWRNLFILYFVFVKKQRTIERKKKRSKISALESCYANRIYWTFGVEMRAYGQKLVKFCTQTHRRVNLSSKDITLVHCLQFQLCLTFFRFFPEETTCFQMSERNHTCIVPVVYHVLWLAGSCTLPVVSYAVSVVYHVLWLAGSCTLPVVSYAVSVVYHVLWLAGSCTLPVVSYAVPVVYHVLWVAGSCTLPVVSYAVSVVYHVLWLAGSCTLPVVSYAVSVV